MREVERDAIQAQDNHPLKWLLDKTLDILRNEAAMAVDEPLIGAQAIMEFIGVGSKNTYDKMLARGLPVYRLSDSVTHSLLLTTKATILNWLRTNAEAYGIARLEQERIKSEAQKARESGGAV